MEGKTFISYARVDRAFAQRLSAELRSAGVDVWLDQIDIGPGELWDDAVGRALKYSSTVVVVLTPSAVASRSVQDEYAYALAANKKVIPVLRENCDIPFRLQRLHYTDFTSAFEAPLLELLHALKRFDLQDSSPLTNHGDDIAPLIAQEPTKAPILKIPHRNRLMGAILYALGGLLYGAVLTWLIYHSSALSGQAAEEMFAGAAVSGVIWGITGAICAMRKRPFVWALGAAIIVAVLWSVLFRTDVEVWAAGVVEASALAALFVALFIQTIVRRRTT